MPVTYEPIATTTLGSNTADVTFSSIPGTYTDLIAVARFTFANSDSTNFRLNGDSGSNYSGTRLYGDGTTAASNRYTNLSRIAIQNLAWASGIQGLYIVQIMNYSNTTTHKTVLVRENQAGTEVATQVGLWRNTAAVTSITFSSINYQSGSMFTLYGIKAA